MVKVIVSGVVAALSAGVATAYGTISTFPAEMTKLMDQTVDPCTDFFSYSCGTWYKDTPLYANQSTTDAAFAVIEAAADRLVEKLLASKLPKLTEFYDACVDTATLDKLGLAPIEAHLSAIRTANSSVEVIGRGASISKAIGYQLFVLPSVYADTNDATLNVLYAQQAELPMGKDYYEDPSLWGTVEQSYRQYIATLFKLAGRSDAEAKAASDTVVAFERAFAGVQLSKVSLREAVTSSYNPMSFAAANATYPLGVGLQLQGFGFDIREGCNTNTILLNDLEFFDRTEALLQKLSVDDLKTIVEYKVLNFHAPHLSSPFVKANWEFFEKVLKGRKEPRSRAMICRVQLDTSIGELLGTYYLKEVWTADTAARADALVLALEASFKTGLNRADWLDDTTRANAKTKLSKFTHLLGGPQHPKTYPSLTFDASSYVANLDKVSLFNTESSLTQIGSTVDKQTWYMTAQTVNAYYDPSVNVIAFPAAILQPPLFDAKADPAVNFGATGATIGHEISHGFDNSGRDYDGDGNLKPWWTANVTDTFNKKAQCIIDQYGAMPVKSEITGDTLGHIDGLLTLGETIADNGGVSAAYRAYKEYVETVADATKYTKETGEKMFWIGYAQSWCDKNSDARLRMLLTNEHPPNRHRLIGSVQNSADFAAVTLAHEPDQEVRVVGIDYGSDTNQC